MIENNQLMPIWEMATNPERSDALFDQYRESSGGMGPTLGKLHAEINEGMRSGEEAVSADRGIAAGPPK